MGFYKVLFSLTLVSFGASANVSYFPSGQVDDQVTQVRVKFDDSMEAVEGAFEVQCSPELKNQGTSNWGDNNSVWVFNTGKLKRWEPQEAISGGSVCKIAQVKDIKSADGSTVYRAGELSKSFSIAGPNVVRLHGYPTNVSRNLNSRGRQIINEEMPIFFLGFDGDIDASSLKNSTLTYYLGEIQETVGLKLVPAEKTAELYKTFSRNHSLRYNGFKEEAKNWAIVQTDRAVAPNSTVIVSVSRVASMHNPGIVGARKEQRVFNTRPKFRAEVTCSREYVNAPTCSPAGRVSVSFSDKVSWDLVKDTYIEYMAPDSDTVQRAYPSKKAAKNNWVSNLVNNFPGVSLGAKSYVDNLSFDVKIKPESEVKVVLPSAIADQSGRLLSNEIQEYKLAFGSYAEEIRFPRNLAFIEKGLGNDIALPVVIMNLHQNLGFKYSSDSNAQVEEGETPPWTSIKDISTILRVVSAYEKRDHRREVGTPYVSPMEELGIFSSERQGTLSGNKNKLALLELGFTPDENESLGGLYVMEIESGVTHSPRAGDKTVQNPTYGLSFVTDLSVTLKSGRDKTLAWVSRTSTGQKVSNASVEIYDCAGNLKSVSEADENGMAFIDPSVTKETECFSDFGHMDRSYTVVARTENDFSFVKSDWYTDGSRFTTGEPGFWHSSPETDGKPIYHAIYGLNYIKPGQKTNVQVIARVPQINGFGNLDETKLEKTLRITSSEDSNVFYDFDLEWKNGVAEVEWKTPQNATLGAYWVQLLGEDDESRYLNGTLEVAEFEVPLFTSGINIAEKELVTPQTIKVVGSLAYAGGVPVKEENVRFVYYFTDAYYSPENYGDFNFNNGTFSLETREIEASILPEEENAVTVSEGIFTNNEGDAVIDVAAQTVANGQTIAEVIPTLDSPKRLVAKFQYRDQNGQWQTASTSKEVYNSAEFVGVKIQETKDDQEPALMAVTLDSKGKAVLDASASYELSLKQIKVSIISEQDFGGRLVSITEKELQDVEGYNFKCSTLETGVLSCALGNISPGNYVFQVKSDGSGLVSYAQFTVSTDGKVNYDPYGGFYDERSPNVLSIATDKETYKGGETARLSFESPFESCSALVTMERNNVEMAFVDELACSNGYVDVPVDSANAPNIYTSIYLVTGRTDAMPETVDQTDFGKPSYRVGYADLKIDWDKFALDVKLSLNKEQYKPREEVTVDLDVSTLDGGSMGEATATVFAVEKNILKLRKNTTQEILKALMGNRSHSVSLVNVFANIVSVVGSKANRMAESALGDSKADEEGGDGSSEDTFRRQLFDALVDFESGIELVDGKGSYTFSANDKLTEFAVFAVVTSANGNEQRFGSGDGSYLGFKEVEATSNISSVAREGDKLPIGIKVRNKKSATEAFAVSVTAIARDASGAEVGDPITLNGSTGPVEVGQSQTASVGDLVVPEGAVSISYTVDVRDGNGALVDSLGFEGAQAQRVESPTPLTTQTEFIRQSSEDGTDEIFLTKVEGAIPGKGSIEAKVFPSLVGPAMSSIKAKAAENRYSDLFVEYKVLSAIIESSEDNQAPLRLALADLLSSTDNNGFVKYYAGADYGNFWMTAELVELLQVHSWWKSAVPVALMEKWTRGFGLVLRGALPDGDSKYYFGSAPSALTYASAQVKTAALAADFSDEAIKEAGRVFTNKMVSLMKSVDLPYGIALKAWPVSILSDVALALAKYDSAGIAFAKDFLEAHIELANSTGRIKGDSAYGWWGYSDDTINTAKYLYAMSAAATGGSDEGYVDNFAKGLVDANVNGRWYNLRTLAWVYKGLDAFGSSFEGAPLSGETTIAITEHSEVAATVSWGAANAFAQSVQESWTQSTEKVVVTRSDDGTGSPWISVVAKSAVNVTEPRGPIVVTKEIENLTTKDGTFKSGDQIKVTLKVQSNVKLNHVAVFDPIPAGANIVSAGWGGASSEQKSYSGYKAYFRTLHGPAEINYQYQLNNTGEFNLPPTRAEALYEPGYFGEGPNKSMTVVDQSAN